MYHDSTVILIDLCSNPISLRKGIFQSWFICQISCQCLSHYIIWHDVSFVLFETLPLMSHINPIPEILDSICIYIRNIFDFHVIFWFILTFYEELSQLHSILVSIRHRTWHVDVILLIEMFLVISRLIWCWFHVTFMCLKMYKNTFPKYLNDEGWLLVFTNSIFSFDAWWMFWFWCLCQQFVPLSICNLCCPMLKIGQHKTLICITLTSTSVIVGVLGVALVAFCQPVLMHCEQI